MKLKKMTKALKLNKTTISDLSDKNLSEVVGGVRRSNYKYACDTNATCAVTYCESCPNFCGQ